jgi:hypothetical protein
MTPYKIRRAAQSRSAIGRHYRICLDALVKGGVAQRLSALSLIARAAPD